MKIVNSGGPLKPSEIPKASRPKGVPFLSVFLVLIH
jgi:hypothetical protein